MATLTKQLNETILALRKSNCMARILSSLHLDELTFSFRRSGALHAHLGRWVEMSGGGIVCRREATTQGDLYTTESSVELDNQWSQPKLALHCSSALFSRSG